VILEDDESDTPNGICAVVERLASSTVTFPLKDKLFVKSKVVAARKHLLFLRMPPVCGSQVKIQKVVYPNQPSR